MKVIKKKLDDATVRLEAVASPQEVDEAFAAAQLAFAQQMNLKPSEGKTIAQAADEQLGIKDIDSVVLPQVSEYLVPFALDKNDTVPAYPPQVNPQSQLKRDSEYKFTLDVALKPDYELSSYDPVSITVPALEIRDEEVDAQIKQMAENYAEFETVDPRPVEKGDYVKLTLESFEDGKPFPNLTAKSRIYTTGAGLMPDGFDENIIGMNVGETKTFSFSGPSVDSEGKEVEQTIDCTATVEEIQEKLNPELTDEWVKKNMPSFDNMKQLRDTIRSQMQTARSKDYEAYKEQLASTELAKRFKGKIADPVYEAMQKNLMDSLQNQLKEQNITYQDYVEQNGGEQQFSMMMMMQTRQNLIEGYSLDAVFRHENMTLNDNDILEACKNMYPQQPEMLKNQMQSTGCGFILREAAARLKANRFIVEQADIKVEGQSS